MLTANIHDMVLECVRRCCSGDGKTEKEGSDAVAEKDKDAHVSDQSAPIGEDGNCEQAAPSEQDTREQEHNGEPNDVPGIRSLIHAVPIFKECMRKVLPLCHTDHMVGRFIRERIRD